MIQLHIFKNQQKRNRIPTRNQHPVFCQLLKKFDIYQLNKCSTRKKPGVFVQQSDTALSIKLHIKAREPSHSSETATGTK